MEGVTAQRLVEAVRSDDLAQVRAMLAVRPELSRAWHHNYQILHYAVFNRSAEMVRVLMQHGANARYGVYPHDGATTPLTIAEERGYDQIAAIIREEEQRRQADPARIERAAEEDSTLTAARKAVTSGDEQWIRAQHALGALPGPRGGAGGLLNVAVRHDQPRMLALLLDLGFDPDERVRLEGDEVEYTWGFPLWECAATGKHEMAETLLKRGADPNAMVYASGTPVMQAYGQRDQKMIQLLERYGGRAADAGLAAIHRLTELAKKKFAEAEDQHKAARDLVWAGATGGDLEIVQFALPLVNLPRDDPRWFSALEGPLRLWNHGPGHWCHPEWDRSTYLECFKLILQRCDPNLRGREPDKGQSGFTILHIVTGGRVAWMTAEEQVAFATALLDAGARLDIRDNLLHSTPLGWACRWGRLELVKLFLQRGADPVEADAEPWATPLAWAKKKGHDQVLALLRESTPGSAQPRV